jgi:hypothetical protein
VGDNDITYPVGTDSTGRSFLNYAVTEPPLVALVSKGGHVLRGWPEGISGEDLRKHIDELAVESH